MREIFPFKKSSDQAQASSAQRRAKEIGIQLENSTLKQFFLVVVDDIIIKMNQSKTYRDS